MTVLSDNAKTLVNRLYGPWVVTQYGTLGTAGTSATVNSGYTYSRRLNMNPTVTVPSTIGNGGIVTQFDTANIGSGPGAIGLFNETLLGTLAVSTNTFTAGSTMPTRSIGGQMVQTASLVPVLVVDVNLTATTPTITITYTNQAGTGGRTATLILPTSPVATSAFLIAPHLQSGDTGVRAITGMSKSAGSAGTLKIYGLMLPHALTTGMTSSATTGQPGDLPYSPPVSVAGDTLAVYHFYGGNNGSTAYGFTMVTDI